MEREKMKEAAKLHFHIKIPGLQKPSINSGVNGDSGDKEKNSLHLTPRRPDQKQLVKTQKIKGILCSIATKSSLH